MGLEAGRRPQIVLESGRLYNIQRRSSLPATELGISAGLLVDSLNPGGRGRGSRGESDAQLFPHLVLSGVVTAEGLDGGAHAEVNAVHSDGGDHSFGRRQIGLNGLGRGGHTCVSMMLEVQILALAKDDELQDSSESADENEAKQQSFGTIFTHELETYSSAVFTPAFF